MISVAIVVAVVVDGEVVAVVVAGHSQDPSRSPAMVRNRRRNYDVKLMYAHWYPDDGNCGEIPMENRMENGSREVSLPQ